MLATNTCLPHVADGERAGASKHVARDVNNTFSHLLSCRRLALLVFFDPGENRVIGDGNEKIIGMKIFSRKKLNKRFSFRNREALAHQYG